MKAYKKTEPWLRYIMAWILMLSICFVTNSQSVNYRNIIEITGSTNVNRFTFSQTSGSLVKEDKGRCWKLAEAEDRFLIFIPLHEFRASNSYIFADFLELLKANEFPEVILSLDKSELKKAENGHEHFSSKVSVILAGVENTYTIFCETLYNRGSEIGIRGSSLLKLTDFKLSPPVKSFGLIRVKNDVIINFELNIPLDFVVNK